MQDKKKREKEEAEFNAKTKNKDDLYSELKEMDAKMKSKHATKQQLQQEFALEEEKEGESPDKRLAMYKRMRQEIMAEESKAKEEAQR